VAMVANQPLKYQQRVHRRPDNSTIKRSLNALLYSHDMQAHILAYANQKGCKGLLK
jgi:hypothetical protein